nr:MULTISPECIES: FliI/YscN family ATPase [unclassified Bradyrhizobium]
MMPAGSATHRLARILPQLCEAAGRSQLRPIRGRVIQVSGTLIRAIVPDARVGDICLLRSAHASADLRAEIVGIEGGVALLTPLGDVAGLSTRTEVVSTRQALGIMVGPALLGRVVDGLGRPLDVQERGWPEFDQIRRVRGAAPAPLARRLVDGPLSLGIRAIDGLLSCGEGQRIGIYGEPGAGKSSLVAQIVQNADVDVCVVALIGERGREVREMVERCLAGAARARSVVIVATSDRPPTERVTAAYVAVTIAEYFRDCNARVLLVQDSVTRFARALREIGLAAGEPPTRRGFPPSVFAALPELLERSGPGVAGSITAFYTVLVEGDGTADPIAEETRSILDGHIALSPKLAQSAHFPAIDIVSSLSRVMDQVVTSRHRSAARRVRELIARYAELEFLLQVGEYKAGTDPIADEAIAKQDAIKSFLRQGLGEAVPWDRTIHQLEQLAS